MVGRILKVLRTKAGLKQDVLAKKLNIDQTTLSGYEVGRRNIDFETTIKLAKECGYDIYFINNKTGDKFKPTDLKRDV